MKYVTLTAGPYAGRRGTVFAEREFMVDLCIIPTRKEIAQDRLIGRIFYFRKDLRYDAQLFIQEIIPQVGLTVLVLSNEQEIQVRATRQTLAQIREGDLVEITERNLYITHTNGKRTII